MERSYYSGYNSSKQQDKLKQTKFDILNKLLDFLVRAKFRAFYAYFCFY